MRNFAVDLARQAGHILRTHYNTGLHARTKSTDVDLVTQADLESEALILEAIRHTYPEHAILSEESGRSGQAGQEYQWIVDPLDGTTNFAHAFPLFAVAITLVHRDALVLAVTYDPLRDEMFVAERGQGTTLNGRAVSVSKTDRLKQSLIGTGFAYIRAETERNNLNQFNRVMPVVQGIRRAGSAALDLAYVACGRLDGYWEFHLNPWDWLGGSLLVEEAGGRISNLDGGPPGLDDRDLIASNGWIHRELLETIGG
ncbi:MAG: inositol monophosphatase family protein [Anaerolineae bacterium]